MPLTVSPINLDLETPLVFVREEVSIRIDYQGKTGKTKVKRCFVEGRRALVEPWLVQDYYNKQLGLVLTDAR